MTWLVGRRLLSECAEALPLVALSNLCLSGVTLVPPSGPVPVVLGPVHWCRELSVRDKSQPHYRANIFLITMMTATA